jgi:pimeloyl-ACP methyl ester carboxylesterase
MTTEPRSGYYFSQRLRLHYTEWGDPEAPPIILQHGGRDHSRSWDRVVEALLPDWRIIAPDLRGHGDSAWAEDGNCGMDDHLYDHAMLFDQLNIERATVIGHSLGGNIVWRHAAARPERIVKLVSIEGLGPSPKILAEAAAIPIGKRVADWINRRTKALQRKRRIYPTLDDAVARLQPTHPHLDAEWVRHLAVHGVEQVEGGYCFKTDPCMTPISLHDFSLSERQDMWRAVSVETLLVYGADSWASSPLADGRAGFFPDARTVVIDGAGHWVHHDKLAEFIALLRTFL